MEEELVEAARDAGAQYADVRVQRARRLAVEMRDGKVKKVAPGVEHGVGLRVLVDGAWGFFSTNRPEPATVLAGARAAVRQAKASAALVADPSGITPAPGRKAREAWRPAKPPEKVPLETKLGLLASMHKAVSGIEGIHSILTSWSDQTLWQRFLSSEGADVTTEVTRILAQTHFVAKRAGRITSRRARIGGTAGYELFSKRDPAEEARRAAHATVEQLGAPAPPAGRFTVVIDPEMTGVFAHEAVGHASEADLVMAGDSVLAGKIGKRIAPAHVTIVDDSRVPRGFGSFPYDDNGVKGGRKVLVERGVVRGYLLDRVSAFKLGMQANGAARAEDYAVRPIVRMSNTFFERGDRSFDELLEGVNEGVYVKGTRGGQVDTARGSFQFSGQEAFRIVKGEVAGPLRDVSIAGMTLETLRNIDAVGKDWRLGDPGICGKGQLVPVGDGGPHLRIRRAVVGGSAA